MNYLGCIKSVALLSMSQGARPNLSSKWMSPALLNFSVTSWPLITSFTSKHPVVDLPAISLQSLSEG